MQTLLPGGEGGDGVTCVSEVREGWGEGCSPIWREKRVDLRRGVKVEQAVSKGAGRLREKGVKEKVGGQCLQRLYISQTAQRLWKCREVQSLVVQNNEHFNISQPNLEKT